jgi:hypothetical protein
MANELIEHPLAPWLKQINACRESAKACDDQLKKIDGWIAELAPLTTAEKTRAEVAWRRMQDEPLLPVKPTTYLLTEADKAAIQAANTMMKLAAVQQKAGKNPDPFYLDAGRHLYWLRQGTARSGGMGADRPGRMPALRLLGQGPRRVRNVAAPGRRADRDRHWQDHPQRAA